MEIDKAVQGLKSHRIHYAKDKTIILAVYEQVNFT